MMKTPKLNFESFASEELSRHQKTTIIGKDGTTLPEIDENGNIIGSGPGSGATGPGGATNTGGGDGKTP